MEKNIIKSKLKQKYDEVVADKVLLKALQSYTDKGQRNVLVITEFDGKINIKGSKNLIAGLRGSPELEYSLHQVFELSTRVADEDLEHEKGEKGVYSLYNDLKLPKLFAPFKDKERGWNAKNVEMQALLYINLLGFGNGGESSFKKATNKPKWFPNSLAFHGPDAYIHPSKASIQQNEDLIESILLTFGYDPKTHCEYPTIPAQKLGGRPKKRALPNEDKVSKNGQQSKRVRENYIDGDGNEEEEEEPAARGFQIPVRATNVVNVLTDADNESIEEALGYKIADIEVVVDGEEF